MDSVRSNHRMILQSDWEDSLREAAGTAWITYKKHGGPSVHGQLTCEGLSVDQTPYVSTSEAFSVDKVSKRSISVRYEDATHKCSCQFQAPSDVFSNIHQSSVTCMDVTSGGLAVSCDTRGNFCLWTTETGDIRQNKIISRVLKQQQLSPVSSIYSQLCISWRASDQSLFSELSNIQVKRSYLEVDDLKWGQRNISDLRNNYTTNATTSDPELTRRFEGHCGDVYSCRFFPSGVVVLTGGADCVVKIWSAENGKCAATLVGHQAGVLDTAVVERGRNVVSVSRDGTAKLWDVGQSQCIYTYEEVGGSINACSLGCVSSEVNLCHSNVEHSDREVMTEGKMLLLALETGSLQGYGLHSREKIFDLKCDSAVNCATFLSNNLVCCGSQGGFLYLVDLRNTETPLYKVKESRAAVLSLLPYNNGVFVGTGDGSCFFVNSSFRTDLELTGSDCDPIYSLASDGSSLFTTCRDKNIRRYGI